MNDKYHSERLKMGLERAGSIISPPSRGPSIGLNKINPSRGPSFFKISSPEFRTSFSKTKSPTLQPRLNINTRPAIKAANPFFEKSIALIRGRNALDRKVEGPKNPLPKGPSITSERPFRGHLADLLSMPRYQVGADRSRVNRFSVDRNFHKNALERSTSRPLSNPVTKFDRSIQNVNIEQPIIYPNLQIAKELSGRNIHQNLNIRPTISRFSAFDRPMQADLSARVEPVIKSFEFKQLQGMSVKEDKPFKTQFVSPELKTQNTQLNRTVDALKTAGIKLPEATARQVIRGEIVGTLLGTPGLATVTGAVIENLGQVVPEKVISAVIPSEVRNLQIARVGRNDIVSLESIPGKLMEIIPQIKVDTEIQKAIRVLSNPAKVDPQISEQYREAVKAQILGLAKGSQHEGINQKTADLVAAFKTTLRLLVKKEVIKKIEIAKIADEELIAEVDDKAMEARFKAGENALKIAVENNQNQSKDTVSLRVINDHFPDNLDDQRSQTSEPLQNDLVRKALQIPDGSLRETRVDLAADTDELTIDEAWTRLKRAISKKVAVRFRRNVTTRRVTNEEVERVFENKTDVISMIQAVEALPQAA